jgi:tRNA nucleotidyltransferase (CCA-adding enzyme)
LDPVPAEALVYLWAAGDALTRERIQRFATVLSRIRPAVSGQDLIALGLEPSPAFSGILAQALDARLDGKAVGREAEMANLKRLVSRAGLPADNPRQGR